MPLMRSKREVLDEIKLDRLIRYRAKEIKTQLDWLFPNKPTEIPREFSCVTSSRDRLYFLDLA